MAVLAVALLSPASPAWADGYQPDFDCAKPPAKNGVATMLCQNSDAAKHELEFDQVYYALRQIVGPTGRKALRQQIVLDENAINQGCGLPIPGADDQTVPPGGSACYITGMDKLTADLKQRLSGVALEEASRDIDTHIALQRRLRDLGYLPRDTAADGVYGEGTRGAITAWQHAAGRPQAAGFISDGDAFTLSRSTVRASVPASAAEGQVTGGGRLHTARTVYACANPRATRALNNAADPRQSDPGWVAYVKSDGRCYEVTPEQSWEHITKEGDLLLLRRTPPVVGEPPLFFRVDDVSQVAPVAPLAAVEQAPVTNAAPDPELPIPSIVRQSPEQGQNAREATGQLTTPDADRSDQSPPVQYAPVHSASPSNSGSAALLIIILLIVAFLGLIFWFRKQAAARRLSTALEVATNEITTQQRPLRIRKLQLVSADAYGTVDISKWVREKEHFLKTRILPLLDRAGLTDQWSLIAGEVDHRIDLATYAPIETERTVYGSDPHVFDPRMTPPDYELHCALLLRSAGWDAQTTKASGDQGTDVLARRAGKVLVVQCKLYAQPVGNSAVQEISAARMHQQADYAAVVSNAAYTAAARQLARTNGVFLLHHEELPAFDPAHHAA